MSTQTRTADVIFAEIRDLQRKVSDRPQLDTAESWHQLADEYDRIRDLWRELGEVANHDGDAPVWAVIAAYSAADHHSDLAERYRQFAREVGR